MSKVINIGGRLHSSEQGNVLTGANEILDDTKGKKQNVINSETDAELLRLEQSKQDNLTFDNAPTENSNNPVKSGGVYAADKAMSDAIEAILLLIPSAASVLNKLADIAFVNSSVSTATATFRGTYNVVTDLELAYDATHEQIAAKLGQIIATADNNDYSFVQIPVSATSTNIRRTERYKFNGTAWGFEYDLNTSGFTAAQWEAINSGITALLVAKLSELPTATELATALAGKQATLTFDNAPTSGSDNPVKSGGIFDVLATKQGTLTFDDAPTENSNNPVKSGGIYTAIKTVADALSDVSDLIPTEATNLNQLADKAYVLAKILDATPAFKGQFVTLAELQAVASPKAGDLGIVRTKDNDGLDVFTFYQYLNNTWNVFFTLQHHPQDKPATTGTTGDYPYNGMGCVELAMNMVNTAGEGEPEVLVNQLTQDMLYKGEVGSRVANTNTIFVIAYDYVLAEDITIPANCVLKFDGGSISGEHTITFNNTSLIGAVSFSGCTFGGSLNYNTCIDVVQLGAANDGVTDVTTILKNIILLAFTSMSNIDGGWQETRTIYFPAGKYIVSDSLIDVYTNSGIRYGMFRFVGENAYNTIIQYSGSNPLFYGVTEEISYTRFENISFIGNQSNTFLKGGKSQSFEYYRCRFIGWHTIFWCIDSIMSSENTFDTCKITSCGTLENPCELFIWDNEQSTNNRFFATDIEVIRGVVHRIKKGINLYHYQGSMMLFGTQNSIASFIKVTDNCHPYVFVHDVKFELGSFENDERYARLITKTNVAAGLNVVFDSVGGSPTNLTSDSDFYAVDIKGGANITFQECFDLAGIKIKYVVDTGDDSNFIIKTSDEWYRQFVLGISVNVNSIRNLPTIVNTTTGDSVNMSNGGSIVLQNNYWRQKRGKNAVNLLFNSDPDRLCYINAGLTENIITSNLLGVVTKFILYNIGFADMGSYPYTCKVYENNNGADGALLATFSANTITTSRQEVVLDLPKPVKDLRVHFEISTPTVGYPWESRGYLVAEYI